MSDRYAVERVKDRLWVVIDKARQGPPVGWSASEAGARDILALLDRIRHSTARRDLRMAPEAA
jgi:hypothetical protein